MKTLSVKLDDSFTKLEVFKKSELAKSTTDQEILELAKIDYNDIVRESYASNPNLNQEELEENFLSDDDAILLGTISNSQSSTEQITTLLQKDVLVANAAKAVLAAKAVPLGFDVNQFLKNVNFNATDFTVNNTIYSAVLSKSITEDTLLFLMDYAYTDKHIKNSIVRNVVSSLKATEKVLLKAFESNAPNSKYKFDKAVLLNAASNANATEKVLDLAFKSPAHENAVKHLNFSLTKLDELIKAGSYIKSAVLSKNITSSQLETAYTYAMKDYGEPDLGILENIVKSEYASEKLLLKCMKQATGETRNLLSYIASNKASTKAVFIALINIKFLDYTNLYTLLENCIANPSFDEESAIEMLKLTDFNKHLFTNLLNCPNIGKKFFTTLKLYDYRTEQPFKCKFMPESIALDWLKTARVSECLDAINNKYMSKTVVDRAIKRIKAFKIGSETTKNKIDIYQYSVNYKFLAEAFKSSDMTILLGAASNRLASEKQILKVLDLGDEQITRAVISNINATYKPLSKILKSNAPESCKLYIFEDREDNDRNTLRYEELDGTPVIPMINVKYNKDKQDIIRDNKLIYEALDQSQPASIRFAAIQNTIDPEILAFALDDSDERVINYVLVNIVLTNPICFNILKKHTNPLVLLKIIKYEDLDLLNLAICSKSEDPIVVAESNKRSLTLI